MSLFANADHNRLQVHTGLRQLSDAIGAAFVGVYLLRQGFSATQVFLVYFAMCAGRLLLRWLVLRVAARSGLRRALIAGAFLYLLQFLALAAVARPDVWLLAYIGLAALANSFYWTAYHAAYAHAGQQHDRGRQLGAREIIAQIASIIGPATGGFALTWGGPWIAFGLAAFCGVLSIVPLLRMASAPIEPVLPLPLWTYARQSFVLFAADGWFIRGAQTAWTLVVFQAFGQQFDAFGAALSGAALAGAVAAFAFGGLIDRGKGRSAVLAGGLCLALLLCLEASVGNDPWRAGLVLVAGAAVGNLYLPGLMTTIYNTAKTSPSPLRFMYYVEGGWDCGAAAGCLVSAGICALGWPLQVAILLGLPAVMLQTWLLLPGYIHRGEPAP